MGSAVSRMGSARCADGESDRGEHHAENCGEKSRRTVAGRSENGRIAMGGDVQGIVLSFVYVFAVIGIATAIGKKFPLEISRKWIHIMCGNWVFFLHYFADWKSALFVPFSFIIINAVSMKYSIFKAMERQDDSFGTVFYAVSMFLSVLIGCLFQWDILPYIGILIMAYGDGLAAVLGMYFGKQKIAKISDKTVLGTAVVFLVSFAVTLFCALYFEMRGDFRAGIAQILAISFFTAVLSSVIEYYGARGTDNLFLPLGSGLFATLCLCYGSAELYIYLILCLLILLFALQKRAITLDGIAAAAVTAVILYTLGGALLGLSLTAFFILGSGVSKTANDRKRRAEAKQEVSGARNWKQVFCNSLPAVFLSFFHHLTSEPIFLLLGFCVFAAAAADTFASELGMLCRGNVYDIIGFRRVAPGVSGGVTRFGTVASLVGSLALSGFAYPHFGVFGVAFATSAGLVNALIDSILGSLIQRKYRAADGSVLDKPEEGGRAEIVRGYAFISNNTVNLISLTITVLLAYGIYILAGWKTAL